MKKKSLTFKILAAMVAGIIAGLILYNFMGNAFIKDVLVNQVLHVLGRIFVNLIKMMVVPLVFVSLAAGASQIADVRKLGRIGGKTIAFYLTTTAIAISIAILVGIIFAPGAGLDSTSDFVQSTIQDVNFEAKESPALSDVILNIVPTNPIAAMANGNMLQIIFFAILVGIGIATIGEKAEGIKRGLERINDLILKIVMMIMQYAPIGVFALVAKTMATLGYDAMFLLGKYMLCVLGALALHAIVTYMAFLYGFTRLNPIQFYKNFLPAMVVAFSTSSSSATLPVTIETAEMRLGIKKELASFTLPLGATINMDGTAIMQGVATVFIAQLYGIPLGVNEFLTVILTATLASIGTAGVPGVGLIMLSMVLQQVGLPVEAIGLILGIDRILDMTRTAINITGDAVCTLIVAKSENEFDEDIFYEKNEKFSYENF